MPLPFKIEDKVICKKELVAKYRSELIFVPGETYTIKLIDIPGQYLWVENHNTNFKTDGSWFSLNKKEFSVYYFYEYFCSQSDIRKLKLQQLSK
jgi:hypothetical protein